MLLERQAMSWWRQGYGDRNVRRWWRIPKLAIGSGGWSRMARNPILLTLSLLCDTILTQLIEYLYRYGRPLDYVYYPRCYSRCFQAQRAAYYWSTAHSGRPAHRDGRDGFYG